MPEDVEVSKMPEWQERLRIENKDLGTKISALISFIDRAPEFKNTAPALQCLMREQLKAMEVYRDLLFARMTLLRVPA